MSLDVEIKKAYDDFKLDVSFKSDNSVMAILGTSGSGKSLTLKCIAGIETPDEGRIVLNDKVLFDSEKKINVVPQKRNVGYMFQDYALFPNMTVKQNIEIACKENNEVEHFLERFQLTGVSTLHPHQISGGQKQRTAIARMLITKPELIMLDEPFSALDRNLKDQMESEVKAILDAEGKPAIFVSHDYEEVGKISKYAGVISNGKMCGVEETKEVLSRY